MNNKGGNNHYIYWTITVLIFYIKFNLDELFGIDLAKLPGTEDGIPAILKLCVQAIEQRGK